MQRKRFDILLSAGGLVLAAVLVVFGFYFSGKHDFAADNVHDQLMAQHISFPARADLTPEEKAEPGLVQYAGQKVDSGKKAEVYANQLIATHLKGIGGGKTYSELSAESRADPTDTKLAGLVQTAFRGETLRGLLLTTYGFDQLGDQADLAMWASFIGGGLFFLLGGLGLVHAIRTPREKTI